MRKRSRKDTNQTAFEVVAEATAPAKNPHAVALGRKGGKLGGPARAAAMTPSQRSASARKAATARWAKSKQPS
jgi:hypothetical protein